MLVDSIGHYFARDASGRTVIQDYIIDGTGFRGGIVSLTVVAFTN